MFRRRKDKSVPAFVGILMLLAAFPVLWFNEGAAVRDYTSIKELARTAVPTSADTRDPTLDGQPVVITGGETVTNTPLTDATFDLSVDGLRLKRTVEMFQWDESITKKGESESVSYRLRWNEGRIASEGFRMRSSHVNPVPPIASDLKEARDVQLGDAYVLSPSLLQRLKNFELVNPATLSSTLDRPAHVDGSWLFLGNAPNAPVVGDLRVRFDLVPLQPISLIAAQNGPRLGEVVTQSGNPYAVVFPGYLEKAALIARANTEVKARTNFIRFGGLVLMVLGLRIVLNKMTGFVGGVPVIGGLVQAGAWLFAVMMGAALALVTIAIAWFAYRPLLSVILLAGAAVALEVLVLRKRRARKTADAPAP